MNYFFLGIIASNEYYNSQKSLPVAYIYFRYKYITCVTLYWHEDDSFNVDCMLLNHVSFTSHTA